MSGGSGTVQGSARYAPTNNANNGYAAYGTKAYGGGEPAQNRDEQRGAYAGGYQSYSSRQDPQGALRPRDQESKPYKAYGDGVRDASRERPAARSRSKSGRNGDGGYGPGTKKLDGMA